ncbi:MAG TPA: hypothetical protein VGG72_35480 [Bryobacteraceae bacterium]|jgi:hypothetical protein
MKLATATILAALSIGTAQASGPVGVYALIDKVVLEPNADNPERILIYGVFSIRTDNQGTFQAPQRGYLYYSLPSGNNRALILREWSDLKAAAGTRTVIAFGGTSFGEYVPDGGSVYRPPAYQPPRLRKSGDKPENPDVYVTGAGLSKMRSDTDYGPVKSLLDFK